MEEDKEMLCVMFEDEINTNTPLTITSISNKLVISSGFLHVLASDKALKQAIIHLCYQQAKHTETSRNILESQSVQKKDHVEEWLKDSQEAVSLAVCFACW